MKFTVEAAKGNFFDREKVLNAADRGTVKALSKWGAFVRQDARTSLRYRDRPSEPGKPPSAHKTMTRAKTNRKGETKVQGVSPLREFLFFAYDPGSKSVVAGPARLSTKLGNAPETLEHGGRSLIRSTTWENHKRVMTTRAVTIQPRPFMAPAAARTNDRLGELFKDSVRG